MEWVMALEWAGDEALRFRPNALNQQPPTAWPASLGRGCVWYIRGGDGETRAAMSETVGKHI